MPPEPANQDESPSPRPALRQRLSGLAGVVRAAGRWVVANRLRAVLVAVAGAVSLSSVVLTWVLAAASRPVAPPPTLEMAWAALDRGAYDEARQLARGLQQQGTLTGEEQAGPAFVLGAAAAYQAIGMPGKNRVAQCLVAARYLEAARQQGFPPQREAEGLYLLGKSLYLSGHSAASRPILREALEVGSSQHAEIHGLLAGAYLYDANPKLDEALAENSLYLADAALSPARNNALLQRAQILLRQGKPDECSATLAKIFPQDDADVLTLRGQVLLGEAERLQHKPDATENDRRRAEQKYRQAIKTLQEAESRDTLAAQATRRATYLIGVCFLGLGDDRAALEQFERAVRLYAESPEAVAAALEEADLSRRLGHDREALAAYRRVLRAVADPEHFSNPWLSLDQLRARTLTAYQHYLSGQNFQAALQLAGMLQPLFSPTRTWELRAELYQTWGQAELAQAEQLPLSKAAPLREQGRQRLRQAGRAFSRLAELQIATRQYPDLLWSSAQAYLRGQDYRNAVVMLRRYQQHESRRRHAQVLVALGEALLSLGQADKALEALRECIELYPRDAATCRARLLAARAFVEKGEPQSAEGLLCENLNGQYLTPAGAEWRQSLFDLARLLHGQGRHEEALKRCGEAVQRYPDDPQSLEARYLTAECYRQLARTAQEKLDKEPAAARRGNAAPVRDLLAKAVDQYRQLQELLLRQQKERELSPPETAMLRSCVFGQGSGLCTLGQYEGAIQVYAAATRHYYSDPAVLEAYVQTAAAYRRLNKPAEARSTIEQAKVVLARLKAPDERFREVTNHGRSEWQALLDRLAKS